ncbi:hypothetical protein [Amycolatopsis sp.]|uniref:hypothetical protein n=1 Tax=Amycolatopsis sp. TaxID=37632 RepID=UPI002E007F03|nr:hypothetical protein [Amycolatopsis sp.]
MPTDSFARTKTYSKVDSPPLGLHGPLVVLSPGFMSHGYVVAGIGHNYESVATTFPDGHTDRVACAESSDRPKIARGRAAEVSFVLDRLTGPNPLWARGIQITRTYVGAFLDRQLRGWPEPLLNRPSTRFSEVHHWAP